MGDQYFNVLDPNDPGFRKLVEANPSLFESSGFNGVYSTFVAGQRGFNPNRPHDGLYPNEDAVDPEIFTYVAENFTREAKQLGIWVIDLAKIIQQWLSKTGIDMISNPERIEAFVNELINQKEN